MGMNFNEDPLTDEELQEAVDAEQKALQYSQQQYLLRRVATLKAMNARLEKKLASLENDQPSVVEEVPADS